MSNMILLEDRELGAITLITVVPDIPTRTITSSFIDRADHSVFELIIGVT